MDSFEIFKRVIKDYLSQMAEMDELFATKFANPDKSVDECCNYIVQVMQKSAKNGCMGCSDDEVFGLAVHYYEEEIKDIKDVSKDVLIVSNQEIELTEEDKENIRKEAMRKAVEEKKAEIKKEAIEQYVTDKVVLTEEDKAEAHQIAFNKLVEEEKEKIKSSAKAKKVTPKKETEVQTSLFD